MKLATWNVNSLGVRLPQVLAWLEQHQPDVLALQEIKMVDEKFPREAMEQAGYAFVSHGQKTYNGVALLSRLPLIDVQKNILGFADEQARVIAGTLGDVRVISAYVPNGQLPGSEKFVYKMNWLTALREWLRQELARYPKLVIMGDYNITWDDADVWDPVALHETIHCTTQEREHLQGLLSLGLHDAFRLFEQAEKSYSWWDYREFAFRRNRGLRIDHILVSDALKPKVMQCLIDKPTRGNERPSDHVPVVVVIE